MITKRRLDNKTQWQTPFCRHQRATKTEKTSDARLWEGTIVQVSRPTAVPPLGSLGHSGLGKGSRTGLHLCWVQGSARDLSGVQAANFAGSKYRERAEWEAKSPRYQLNSDSEKERSKHQAQNCQGRNREW